MITGPPRGPVQGAKGQPVALNRPDSRAETSRARAPVLPKGQGARSGIPEQLPQVRPNLWRHNDYHGPPEAVNGQFSSACRDAKLGRFMTRFRDARTSYAVRTRYSGHRTRDGPGTRASQMSGGARRRPAAIHAGHAAIIRRPAANSAPFNSNRRPPFIADPCNSTAPLGAIPRATTTAGEDKSAQRGMRRHSFASPNTISGVARIAPLCVAP